VIFAQIAVAIGWKKEGKEEFPRGGESKWLPLRQSFTIIIGAGKEETPDGEKKKGKKEPDVHSRRVSNAPCSKKKWRKNIVLTFPRV